MPAISASSRPILRSVSVVVGDLKKSVSELMAEKSRPAYCGGRAIKTTRRIYAETY